jgi:hypothetical protein
LVPALLERWVRRSPAGASGPLSPLEIEATIRVLVHAFAEELVSVLLGRASIPVADVSPRRRKKEDGKWRDEERANEFLDPIARMESGESSWSEQEAKRLLSITKPKRKPSRS